MSTGQMQEWMAAIRVKDESQGIIIKVKDESQEWKSWSRAVKAGMNCMEIIQRSRNKIKCKS